MRKIILSLMCLIFLNSCYVMSYFEKKVKVSYENDDISIEESDTILVLPTILLKNSDVGQGNIQQMYDHYSSILLRSLDFKIISADDVKDKLSLLKDEREGSLLMPSSKMIKFLKVHFKFKYFFRLMISTHQKEGSFSERTIFLTAKIYDINGGVIRGTSFQYEGEDSVSSKQIFKQVDLMIRSVVD